MLINLLEGAAVWFVVAGFPLCLCIWSSRPKLRQWVVIEPDMPPKTVWARTRAEAMSQC